MSETKLILNEGLMYLKKLHGIDPKNSRLGSEVLYNFVTIGIESVLTAVLMAHNKMVDHSSILQLLRELEKVEQVDKQWIEKARFMNKFQSYCSLEPIPAKVPEPDELVEIVNFGLAIETYGKEKVKTFM